jgi:hypothetical protein
MASRLWPRCRSSGAALAIYAMPLWLCQSIANTTASDSLIVDDEADIRELVADILYDEGYGTRTARDTDEALSAVVAR